MSKTGCVSVLISTVPLLAVGVILLVVSSHTDPSALADDGVTNLKDFFFYMGSGFVLLPIVLLIIILPSRLGKRKKMKNLLATGRQGQAVVLGLEDTGLMVNDNPRVKLLLEVHIEGYPPYQVQKTVVVPLIRLAQVQVGSVVPVVADPTRPDNPNKLGLLLW
jgi:uncharacterized membrane protein YwaF